MPQKGSVQSGLVNVGRLSGAFGVKGWVKVLSFTEPKENIVKYTPWWLKTRHGVKPCKILDYRFQNDGLMVHLEGIDSRDQAATLNLIDVAVERDQMPELSEGEFYWHQLVGLDVIALSAGKKVSLGRVKALLETGANDVLVVEADENSIDNRERLVPYVPDTYVDKVDLENGTIQVLWDPEF